MLTRARDQASGRIGRGRWPSAALTDGRVAVVVAVLVSALVVALIDAPRLTRGPLPEELLGDASWTGPRTMALLALSAGVCAAMVCGAVQRLFAAAGGFGVVAASALASGAHCLVFADVGGVLACVGAFGFGAAAAIASPLLRDRGLLSLLLVSLLGCGLIIPARRASLAEHARAAELAVAREALLQVGFSRVVISVSPDVALPFRQALAVSLRQPSHEAAVDVLCVEHGSLEEVAMMEAGWRGVRLEDGAPRALAQVAAAEASPPPFEVSVRELEARGPVAVVRPAEGRYRLSVVTPAGAVQQEFEDPTRGLRLRGDAFDRYQQMMAPLPPAAPVYLRVVAVATGRGSTWLKVPR